jgi:hypothetical protein
MNRTVGLLVIGVGIGLVGCGKVPPPPEVPENYDYEFKYAKTGEPLTVKGESFTYTATERVEVGERQIYAANGQRVGSDRLYANQQVARRGYQWDVYQGTQTIDTLSALHIARDSAFEEAFEQRLVRVRKSHEKALPAYEEGMEGTQTKKKVGAILGITGIAGMLLGTYFITVLSSGDEPALPRGASIGISLGFTAMGITGFYLAQSASTQQQKASQKANELAAAKVSASDFPTLTSEDYMHDVARKYNATMAKPEPPPHAKDHAKDKKKKKK